MKTKISICVFCSARLGQSVTIQKAAQNLGELIAQKNFNLVYGGGHVGLMGLVADSCLALGGNVIGVIPKSLHELEVAHTQLQDLRIVESMHERKALMEKLSDIIVALPGGFGTLDELNEIITWRQLGFHKMPIFLLNIDGFYDDFLNFLDKAVVLGYISGADRETLQVCKSVEEFGHHLSSLSSLRE